MMLIRNTCGIQIIDCCSKSSSDGNARCSMKGKKQKKKEFSSSTISENRFSCIINFMYSFYRKY